MRIRTRRWQEKMVNCIYNGNVNQRIEAAKNLAKETDVDGAILFAHWGCKGTIGASSLIKSSLEKDGLPTMILDGTDAIRPTPATVRFQRDFRHSLKCWRRRK